MSLLFNRNSNSSQSSAKKSRRPAGISRRRRRQLGFEPLEDRRVMSAESPLYDPLAGLESQSYSSKTQEGQQQILANELFWQSLYSSLNQTEAVTNGIPTDPFLNSQWHLINTAQEVGNPDYQPIYGVAGEDINVAPVWNQNIFGNGIKVGVFDSGVQTTHPDLAGNIDPLLQFDALTGGSDANPNLINPGNAHGTAVAGLIGAISNNGLGGTGVAPGVQLVPVRLIDAGQTEQAFIDAFRFATDNGLDITNNSWGPGVSRTIAGPTPAQLLAIRDSIVFGRDGKGIIHVFSSGNNAGTGFQAPGGFQDIGTLDSSGYNGWVNSRYTIGVTGVDHDGFYDNVDGTYTGYPEIGGSVLVAAPTGSNAALNIATDTGLGSGIWTTDTLGETGYNTSDNTGAPLGDRDFLEDINFTSRFNGTSASAPIVSGVIALMLEANPNLTWRDVQEILVRSARQNAEFGVPKNGSDQGSGTETLNTWIVNQMEVFHDPDPLALGGSPIESTLFPRLDPNIDFGQAYAREAAGGGNIAHYAPAPYALTNGAGYTVSMGTGTNGEQIGYAHGVVDAELAVLLAQQWATKNQTLSPELTFTTFVTTAGNELGTGVIPAAEKGNEDSGFQLVPGGLSGEAGFIAYWNEFFADMPDFSQTFNNRGGGASFSVPANNSMSVETVEVKIHLSGGTAEALDNLRILLVSPSGTSTELNNYYIEPDTPFTLQNSSPSRFLLDGASPTEQPEDLIVTFSSNRSWGERSDDVIVMDASTNEPVMVNGVPLTSGWQIHFENYGSTEFQLNAMEMAWHGNPIEQDINTPTQRVQGLVGIDTNQDNAFNYSRVIQQNTDTDGVLRYGEIQNLIDPNHEDMASNVTVVARRASDNAIVDQFVTGADGNYYFDLVPDEYIISVEDPLGRSAIEDTLSPSNILQDYRTEWTITSDFFKAWDYNSSLEVNVDGSGVPLSFSGTPIASGMKHINFLLDPGPPVAPQIQFSGVVMADLNGDGLFNGTDVNVPNAVVYADTNRNGQLDAGEQFVQTGADGQYNLIVPATIASVVNIGVQKPAGWTFIDPTSGVTSIFGEPGDVFTGIDFDIMPPLGTGAGNGTSQPGYLIGNIYEDVNNNGTRQSNELGVPNTTVFIDANNNGTREIGEPQTTTNVNGAYIFANVAPGIHRIRVIPTAPLMSINPGPGVPRVVTLSGGGTVSQIEFGIGLGNNPSGANLDFGDLPAYYGITTLAENGARHGKSAYFLGSVVDVDLDGNPSDLADGDDLTNFDDEDGIVVTPLIPGTTGQLVATASRHGGNLQGWFDFNDNGVFEASEKVISNVALLPGANNVSFQIPADMELKNIYARFRYGEYGINSVTGPAVIGEVEDYLVPLDPGTVPAVIENGPDFDEDGDVDGRDFLAWIRGYGKSSGAAPSDGDSNSDGKVDGADLQQWQTDYGTSSAPLVVALTTGGDEDESVNDPELPLAVAPIIVPQTLSTFSSATELSNSESGTSHTPVVINGVSNRGSSLSSNVAEVSAQESTATLPSQRTLSAVANEVVGRRTSHRATSGRVAARLESHRIDQVFEQSSDLAEIGLALREGIHDRRLAGLHRRFEHEQVDSEVDGNENAFDLALSEEILWRAM
ncbi:S8 family serine peptidase [Bythopirellula goksoeyrii]|uniref:Calcium-dependent protease n=1 Tax=Bythopirellula goksoeyrii TaxID=1400387 RepID=A0A5B9QKR8_9BACT|nr:S8 family serine peptidase [Bythopirellula goksoeyrii]QEG34673.1 Calcium-dependent protease precursor [Bythopirellula goksoeyrii]